jgi:hypothetical protein
VIDKTLMENNDEECPVTLEIAYDGWHKDFGFEAH